jgi:hypothetical protein
MIFEVGQKMNWTPMYWRWDKAREVSVLKLYPRGFARLSNNVIVDEDGLAAIYEGGRHVGRVTEVGVVP